MKICIISIIALSLFFSYNLFADRITYNSDGSITVTGTDGNKSTVSMDGKTPFGETVNDKRKLLKNKDTVVEIIYSGKMSDINLSNESGKPTHIEKFYDELVKRSNLWLSKNNSGKDRIQIIVSNCKFCKTGYCRRTNRQEIRFFIYKNDDLSDEFSLSHQDIMGRDGSTVAAATVAKKIFSSL